MSCRFSICVSVVAVAGLSLAAGGCTEVRGRKLVQEANELYKRGRYREAVAVYEQAETMVPALPTLWLNKGYTCRQLIAPGGKDADSRRAADCALAAFKRLGELAPRDARADQLTIQTWFDIDDFPTLEKTFLERAGRAPNDYEIVHGLQEVYFKWGKWPQALQWSERAAALRATDAEAQYGVGTFIWQILAAHGGGADMAAFDPRPRLPPETDEPPASGQPGKTSGKSPGKSPGKSRKAAKPPEAVAPPPPATAPSDITGKQRVELADQAIAYLDKALALRPHYADAMTYMGLCWRQKSFALFAEPAAWQAAVNHANEWQRKALVARTGKS